MSPIPREVSGHGPGEVPRPLFAVDEGWVEKRLPNVEAAINQLIDEFCKNPYLHRVEHSLHCELYGHLVASGDLGKTQDYGLVRPRLVQKEWPETIPRKKKDGTPRKRGNFDLVVLGPPEKGKPPSLQPDQFQLGLIKPGVVIEIGLGYDLDHLQEDLEKLTNSKVGHGYLIHLSRVPHRSGTINEVEAKIDDLIAEETKDERIKVAYAHLVDDGKDGKEIRYRKLGDKAICSVRSEPHS